MVKQNLLNMCKVVYLGGSIIKEVVKLPKLLEAAKIIHGSNVDNFKEIYALLNNIGVSSKINGVKDAKIKLLKT